MSHIFETNKGQPWSFVGAIHSTVAAIANDLAAGTLRDISGDVVASIQMTTLGELFRVGKSHDSWTSYGRGSTRHVNCPKYSACPKMALGVEVEECGVEMRSNFWTRNSGRIPTFPVQTPFLTIRYGLWFWQLLLAGTVKSRGSSV